MREGEGGRRKVLDKVDLLNGEFLCEFGEFLEHFIVIIFDVFFISELVDV